MVPIRLKLIGLFKICNKQLPYLVNSRKSYHTCSLHSRCHYFVFAHSCSTLPFYYNFQPTYNLTKALYNTVLIADGQFLLLIDVPIQNRVQQLQIYEVFHLPVPHSNLSAEYKVNYKYIGVMYDETKAVAISDLQYRACQHANGQFFRINAPFQPLANQPSCVTALYAKNEQAVKEQCSLVISHMPHTFVPIAVASNL